MSGYECVPETNVQPLHPHTLICMCVLLSISSSAQPLCPKDEYGVGRNAMSGSVDFRVNYCTALIRRGEGLGDVMPSDKVWLTDTFAPIFTKESPVLRGDLLVPPGSYSR